MDIDELEEVITSLRVPNGWLVRAEALAPMLSSVPELGSAYGSNTSRSAVLRLALIRGLLSDFAASSRAGRWQVRRSTCGSAGGTFGNLPAEGHPCHGIRL